MIPNSPRRHNRIQTDDTPLPDGRDGRVVSDSFLLPVVVTIGAAVFGKYAQDVTQWVVCGHSVLKGNDSCTAMARAEALNVGTLISTMIAVATAAAAVSHTKITAKAAATTIIGALIAALVVLLKAATEGDANKLPRSDLLGIPLYFYAICVLLFTIPLLLAPRAPRDLGPALHLQFRLAVAVLVGVIVGWVAQLGAELYWKGLDFSAYGAQKFVVAPSATAIAVGTWAVALFDPYLRPTVWAAAPQRRQPWTVLYSVGAIVLAGGYGVLFRVHTAGAFAIFSNAVVIVGLALPPLGALALGFRFRRVFFRRRLALAASLLGGVLATATSVVFTWLELGSGMPSNTDILPFTVAQVLASIAAVLTVFGTHGVVAAWSSLSVSTVGR